MAAAIITLLGLVEETQSEGSQAVLNRIRQEEAADATLPVILHFIDQYAAQMTRNIAEPTLFDDLSRKALLETLGGVLQGRTRDLTISERQIARNLETAVTRLGVTHLLSAFLGNYLAGITLFYAGNLISENVGVTKRLATLVGKQTMEEDVRAKSRDMGRWLATRVTAEIPKRTLSEKDINDIAEVLSRLLAGMASEFEEE